MWDVLCCPMDRGSLEGVDGNLVCRECGASYPILHHLPTFLCRAEHTGLCGSAALAWRMAEAGSPRRPNHAPQLERLVARFAPYDRSSRLLQVGACRNGGLEGFTLGRRYAVDPRAGRWRQRGWLPRPARRSVAWLSACGHDLPFADATFDAVLVAPPWGTSAAWDAALAEAARAVCAEGVIFVTAPETLRLGTQLVERARQAGLGLVWSCAIAGATKAFVFRPAACYTPGGHAAILASKLRLVA